MIKRVVTGALLLIPFIGTMGWIWYSALHDPTLLNIVTKILYVYAGALFVFGLAIVALFIFHCTKNGLSLILGTRAPKDKDD